MSDEKQQDSSGADDLAILSRPYKGARRKTMPFVTDGGIVLDIVQGLAYTFDLFFGHLRRTRRGEKGDRTGGGREEEEASSLP